MRSKIRKQMQILSKKLELDLKRSRVESGRCLRAVNDIEILAAALNEQVKSGAKTYASGLLRGELLDSIEKLKEAEEALKVRGFRFRVAADDACRKLANAMKRSRLCKERIIKLGIAEI